MPAPTATTTSEPKPSVTPQPTATPIPTPVYTATPSATPEPTATATPEPTATPTAPEPPENAAPLFTLPNGAADGELISLGSYRGDKNVVLVFYRGFW